MQTVLIVVHLLIVLALIVTVLLQRSEGGLGLGGGGSSGGVSGFMTGRGQANALTRATAILATLFFGTSITLAIMAHHNNAPRSILDGSGNPQPGAQQEPKEPQSADGLLNELRNQGGQQPAGGQNNAAPAAPAAPAPEAPPASSSPPEAPQSR